VMRYVDFLNVHNALTRMHRLVEANYSNMPCCVTQYQGACTFLSRTVDGCQ
jgi:hypothetical protein